MNQIIEFCANAGLPFELKLNARGTLFIKINNNEDIVFNLKEINFDELYSDLDFKFNQFLTESYE